MEDLKLGRCEVNQLEKMSLRPKHKPGWTGTWPANVAGARRQRELSSDSHDLTRGPDAGRRTSANSRPAHPC